MSVFYQLKKDLIKFTKIIAPNFLDINNLNLEVPRQEQNCDLSSNIAMILAKNKIGTPKEIGEAFKSQMSNLDYIDKIEIAGAGFLNFTIKHSKWHQDLKTIFTQDIDNITATVDLSKLKVNIEYVSANPTGPLHIGHARGAVYGDALARLLYKCGYEVTREYYVNDAGSQITDLTNTVMLRYIEAITGEPAIIPQGLYPGAYLIPIGQDLAKKYGDSLLKLEKEERDNIIKDFAVNANLELIKTDLKALAIEHDVFFSEKSLHDQGKIDKVVEHLQSMDLVYEGVIPAPKGKIDEEWQERTQLLFRSTAFGDDQDRALQKADGSWSYFAADLAYAQDKIVRGFDSVVYVLGADHGGYVARIKAIIKALSDDRVITDVKLCQLVNFLENGVSLKMSKRAGSFTTVDDVVKAVGADVVRFIMLTRKNDIVMDFDLAHTKEMSKENPVFYVQYAHVRTISIIENAKDNAKLAYELFNKGECDLSLLSTPAEMSLIKQMALWVRMIEGSAKYFEPHRVVFYLINLASEFHAIWNLGKENNNYKFVIHNNNELTAARLALAKCVQKIIVAGLEIVGIEPMEKM